MATGRAGWRVLVAASLLCGGVAGGARVYAAERAPSRVNLVVIMVSASGTGGKAQFDQRIPRSVRRRLAQLRLAYAKYVFLGAPRQQAVMGSVASFPLPASEALTIQPFAHGTGTRMVRLDTRILDSRKRPILTSQMRVSYGGIFFLHRPKGASGLLLGISAHRVGR